MPWFLSFEASLKLILQLQTLLAGFEFCGFQLLDFGLLVVDLVEEHLFFSDGLLNVTIRLHLFNLHLLSFESKAIMLNDILTSIFLVKSVYLHQFFIIFFKLVVKLFLL